MKRPIPQSRSPKDLDRGKSATLQAEEINFNIKTVFSSLKNVSPSLRHNQSGRVRYRSNGQHRKLSETGFGMQEQWNGEDIIRKLLSKCIGLRL